GMQLPATLLNVGGRRQWGNLMAKAATEVMAEGGEAALRQNGLDSLDDLTDALSPSIVKPGQYTVSPANMAHALIDQARELLDQMPRLLQTGRFADTAEFQRALEDFVEKTRGRLDNRVVDVGTPTSVRLADDSSVTQVQFTVGKEDGTGWASRGYAERNARELGYGSADIVQGEDGQFFWRITRTMPETGAYSNVLNVKTRNVLSRFLLGARQRSDEFLANKAQASENTRNAMINNVARRIYRQIRIDPASRERIAQLWQAGENHGRWWTADEANALYQRTFNRDISAREWEAYNRLRQVNDLEFLYRNDIAYKELAVSGRETVSVDITGQLVDRRNAVVDTDFTKPIRIRAINLRDNSPID